MVNIGCIKGTCVNGLSLKGVNRSAFAALNSLFQYAVHHSETKERTKQLTCLSRFVWQNYVCGLCYSGSEVYNVRYCGSFVLVHITRCGTIVLWDGLKATVMKEVRLMVACLYTV